MTYDLIRILDSIPETWEGISEGGYCTVVDPSLDGLWAVGRIIVPQRAQPMMLSGLGRGLFSPRGLTLLEAHFGASQ